MNAHQLSKDYHIIKRCFNYAGWHKRHQIPGEECFCEQKGYTKVILKCWINSAIELYNMQGIEKLCARA